MGAPADWKVSCGNRMTVILREAFFSRFRVTLKCHTDFGTEHFTKWLENYKANIKKDTFEQNVNKKDQTRE